VVTSAEQRASEQMPPETPSVEQAASEERRDLEPKQEVPDQSVATQAHRRVVY
jgi:hypothetical protein